MAVPFGRRSWREWKKMVSRSDELKESMKKLPGRVMFPSSHDIVDVSPFREACMTVLGKLLNSGNRVLITTKPRMSVTKEIDRRYHRFKSLMQFRFTMTSINDEALAFWEPNAPGFEERLDSLRYAFRRGYKTSVSIEPFLDYDPTKLIESVSPFVTESIWIGKMNYIRTKGLTRTEKRRYEKIRKNYETKHLAEIYMKFRGYQLVRFKDSIRIKLGSVSSKEAMESRASHDC